MRRLIPLLLPVLLLFALAGPGPAPLRAQAELQGDVNCDSSVNAVDSLQVLRNVAGLSTNADCLDAAGDVNCDAAVNAVDALRILRHIAGLANQPVGGCVPIGEALEPAELPPTSEELIAAALAAGEIDYGTSLLYRAYALYGQPQLPEQYQSPVIDLHAGLDLFREIAANEETLSADLLADLQPFLARPNDPASIFNQAPAAGSTVSALSPASADPLGEWVSTPAAGGKARVWVKKEFEGDLEIYGPVVTDVWNNLRSLIREPIPDEVTEPLINPDSAIDIYFVDVGDVDQRAPGCRLDPDGEGCRFLNTNGAYTRPVRPRTATTASAAILVHNGASGVLLISHLAHELFHASQFSYDYQETEWLLDSTATWASSWVLRDMGVARTPVYEYLPDFFQGLHKPLTRNTLDDLNRYASWLYFLSLEMDMGQGIGTEVWQKAAAAGQQGEAAVDQAAPFAQRFAQFTLRNWNQDGVPPDGRYKAVDSTFPTHKPSLAIDRAFDSSGEQPLNDEVGYLAAAYSRFTFGEDIRSVTVRNPYAGRMHAHVWALVKIADEWKEPRDWTNEEEAIFCRDLPAEDIEELIIVVSNSDWQGKQPLMPAGEGAVEATANGCNAWVGTAMMTSHITDIAGADYMDTTMAAGIRFEIDPENPPGFGYTTYVSTAGTVNWQHHGAFNDPLGLFSCTSSRSETYSAAALGYLTLHDPGTGIVEVEGSGGGPEDMDVATTFDCGGEEGPTIYPPGDSWFTIPPCRDQDCDPPDPFTVSEDGSTISGSFTSEFDFGIAAGTSTQTWNLRRAP